MPTGDVRSWRIQRFEPGGGNDVELLVKAPDGERMVYEVPLQWRRGDWRLVAPQSSKRSVFGVSPALGAAGFTPFIEQPEQKP